MKRMKKGLKAGLIGLLAGAAGMGGAAALGSYFYDLAMTPKVHDPALDTDPDDPIVQGRRWVREHWGRRDIFLTSVDGLRLHGNVMRQKDLGCHRWALCIHGYSDSSEAMGIYARHYYDELGWNVVLPDLRGHGGSEGTYVGYGWDDRLDIVAWVAKIMRRDPAAEIVLHGVSMGAATALLTAGGALPDSVKAVVSDCSYTSALAIMRHIYEHGGGRGPAGPALSALRTTARRRIRFDLKNADVLRAVRSSKTPTLFIHGVSDDFVPATMMADLYETAKCPKEFLWVPKAGHAQSVAVDPELYWRTVDSFIQRALRGEIKR